MTNLNRKIVIVHSGAEDTMDDLDTLNQVKELGSIFEELGFVVNVHDVLDPELLPKLTSYAKQDIMVLNLVESYHESDAKTYQFTALLDFLGLKYSGASTEFLLLTSDKLVSKKLLRSSNISTANWLEAHEVTNQDLTNKYIVKSISEHCSFGIDETSVADHGLKNLMLKKQQEFGGKWFAEEYIEGSEFNVSVLKINGRLQVLPIPEMVFDSSFTEAYNIVHYKAKWDETSSNYDKLQRKFYGFDNPIVKKICANALAVCQVFGINSYARIDFRVDSKEEPFVIDINANPCLSLDAGFMAASQEFGLNPKDVMMNILSNIPN